MAQQQVTTNQIDVLMVSLKQLHKAVNARFPRPKKKLWVECLKEAKQELIEKLQQRSGQCIGRPTQYKYKKKTPAELIENASLEVFLYSLDEYEQTAMMLKHPEQYQQLKDRLKQTHQESVLFGKPKEVIPPQSTTEQPERMQQQVEDTVNRIANRLYRGKDSEYDKALCNRNNRIVEAVKQVYDHTLLTRDYFLTIPQFSNTLLTADFGWVVENLTADEICQLVTDERISECIEHLESLLTALEPNELANNNNPVPKNKTGRSKNPKNLRRDKLAYEFYRKNGGTWGEIANEFEYPSSEAARKAIKRYAKKVANRT